MSSDPLGNMQPMDLNNPAVGGHTKGNPGVPFQEYTFTTPEGESATINGNIRYPEYDDSNGHHFNLVSNVDGKTGFDNTHISVNEQDY